MIDSLGIKTICYPMKVQIQNDPKAANKCRKILLKRGYQKKKIVRNNHLHRFLEEASK